MPLIYLLLCLFPGMCCKPEYEAASLNQYGRPKCQFEVCRPPPDGACWTVWCSSGQCWKLWASHAPQRSEGRLYHVADGQAPSSTPLPLPQCSSQEGRFYCLDWVHLLPTTILWPQVGWELFAIHIATGFGPKCLFLCGNNKVKCVLKLEWPDIVHFCLGGLKMSPWQRGQFKCGQWSGCMWVLSGRRSSQTPVLPLMIQLRQHKQIL